MKNISLLFLALLFSTIISAQELDSQKHLTTSRLSSVISRLDISPENDSYRYSPKMNLIKINLTGIPIRNYSGQYERVLNKVISVGLSYRNMPEGNLPFKKQILNSIDDNDTESKHIVNNFRLSNYAITPEIRFYFGKKGYGQGFYIAPFYRNAGYEGSNFDVEYTDDNNNNQIISLSGDIKSNTFGVLFGAQWSLGKCLVLDWWILGPHIGGAKGSLIGNSSRALSEADQADIKQILDDFDIPLVNKEVIVNTNSAEMNLDGIFGGLRAGITFGIKF
ncbi:MAG: hypothetical protein WC125_07125 [Bacteroidales bacterium]|nr:hypothetical protein [Bacteroidales bacterium]